MKIGIIAHSKQDANNFLNSLPEPEDGIEYNVLDSNLDLLEDYQAIRFYLSTKLPESYSLEVSFRCRDIDNALLPFIIYF